MKERGKKQGGPTGLTELSLGARGSGLIQAKAPAILEAVEPSEDGGNLALPDQNQVLETILGLNRRVSVDMHDEEIVHTYVEALEALLPHRLFVIRLVELDSGDLSLVYANGKLREDRRQAPEVTREAVERHSLLPTSITHRGIGLAERYDAVFDRGSHGFDVPLMDGDHMIGVLGVEYPEGVSEPMADRALVVPIALQLGAALRNSKLLRESTYLRDYLGKLVDHANAPILVMSRERHIKVANRALLALLGAQRGEILGRDFIHLMPQEDRSRLLPVFISALRGEPTSNVEVKLPKPHGGSARLAINTASIRGADGEIEAVIAIGRDLTEVRELEEQVIQAEKLATLGQLAAGVVHELNNPLTSISVYSDYLQKRAERTGADSSDIEKLRRIGESAERILRFTQDLVTYARPSNEEPVFVSLTEVLDQSVVFCDHVIQETGATVDKRYPESLAPVYGVKGQLHQVFINLITNACHAMPDGAGKLLLSIEPADDDRLEVIIHDNGKGIPPGQIQKVFEPFFSTKGEGKGTGLGLSIVRNIVDQHRGEIEVESLVGQGTRFKIVLPCRPHDRS